MVDFEIIYYIMVPQSILRLASLTFPFSHKTPIALLSIILSIKLSMILSQILSMILSIKLSMTLSQIFSVIFFMVFPWLILKSLIIMWHLRVFLGLHHLLFLFPINSKLALSIKYCLWFFLPWVLLPQMT